MRDISTITVQEGAGLWDAVMPVGHKPFKGTAHHFDADDTAPERVCFQSGCERLGIYFTGRIWADCDLSTVGMELDQEKIRAYLTGIGISLPEPEKIECG